MVSTRGPFSLGEGDHLRLLYLSRKCAASTSGVSTPCVSRGHAPASVPKAVASGVLSVTFITAAAVATW